MKSDGGHLEAISSRWNVINRRPQRDMPRQSNAYTLATHSLGSSMKKPWAIGSRSSCLLNAQLPGTAERVIIV
jgi:hypothetical protein